MRYFALALFFFALPVLSFAVPFWPTPPNETIYHYVHTNGTSQDFQYTQEGTLQFRNIMLSNPFSTGGEYYEVTTDSVGLGGFYSYVPGGCVTDMNFSPPVTIVRPGMQTGDSWIWNGDCSFGSGIIIITVTAEEVSVPFGTFDVLHISLHDIYGCGLPFSDLYLHQESGPVKMDNWSLIGIDQTVPTNQTTLDQLKAIYR